MKLKLLYVDDDEALRDLVQFSLRLDPDIDLSMAASGAEALAVLPELRPAGVLLDVMMPDFDGPGVLSAMRADPRLADLPVIFVTARALPEERARLMDLGAAGVIIKPIDPMGFAKQVRGLLGVAHGGG